jgi:hypothetical protein
MKSKNLRVDTALNKNERSEHLHDKLSGRGTSEKDSDLTTQKKPVDNCRWIESCHLPVGVVET